MVSYVIDIDSEEKQKLLEMDSTSERLRMLLAHLSEVTRKLEDQRAYKDLMAKVRGNGDLGKPHTEQLAIHFFSIRTLAEKWRLDESKRAAIRRVYVSVNESRD
jgi:hypothetical protein